MPSGHASECRARGNGGNPALDKDATRAVSKSHEPDVPDAGLRNLDHCMSPPCRLPCADDSDKYRLPSWRHHLRQRLIPLIRWETPYLARLQTAMRTPALDSYFAVTANLGTHTFFMIMLPILFWCGHTTLGRGLVHVLASGVFFSGWLKDLLCLPRPLSPPLQRITMSGSAALEYGFPSTHSTNAISVVVYLLFNMHSPSSTIDPATRITIEMLCYGYAASILLGRLYCGMHGFLDVVVGGALGAILSVIQCVYGEAFDQYLYSSGTSHRVLIVVLVVCVLVRTHPEPADDCPCFDDSVAFAGVTIGCEVGNWHYAGSGWAWDNPVPATVPFVLSRMTYAQVVARIVFGVLTIFLWREIMKPSLLRGLPPVFRVIERLGLNLPRRFFVQASEYNKVPAHLKDDNVIPSVAELPQILTAIRHPRKRAVSIGPQSAADAYETLAYREKRRRESVSSASSAIGEQSESAAADAIHRAYLSMPTSPTDSSTSAYAFTRSLADPMRSQPPTHASPSPLSASQPESPSPAASTRREQDQADADRAILLEQCEDREIFSHLERPRVRYDVEVVTKLIVYAGTCCPLFRLAHVADRWATGIALLAVEGNPILFEVVGLGLRNVHALGSAD